MNKLAEFAGLKSSPRQSKEVDIEGRTQQLIHDLNGLLRHRVGTELLGEFCMESAIEIEEPRHAPGTVQLDSEERAALFRCVLREAVVQHFQDLERKPRVLSKFRRQISGLINTARNTRQR